MTYRCLFGFQPDLAVLLGLPSPPALAACPDPLVSSWPRFRPPCRLPFALLPLPHAFHSHPLETECFRSSSIDPQQPLTAPPPCHLTITQGDRRPIPQSLVVVSVGSVSWHPPRADLTAAPAAGRSRSIARLQRQGRCHPRHRGLARAGAAAHRPPSSAFWRSPPTAAASLECHAGYWYKKSLRFRRFL